MDVNQAIIDFHEQYGCGVGDLDITDLGQFGQIELRVNLIQEEHREFFDEISQVYPDKEKVVKEAIDLVYVLVGLLVRMGVDFNEAFRIVHESNMSKLGEDGKPIYREDGKVLKGPNYKKADMSKVV